MRVVDPAGWTWTVHRRFLPWRLLERPWIVAAHGRRDDGMRVRYQARTRTPAALRDAVADEIRTGGAPRSLGAAVPVRADDATALDRDRLRDGGEVTVSCLVQGFGAAKSRDGWIEGRLTAVPGLLSFHPGDGLQPATWPLLGSDDPDVALAGGADRAAVGWRVVASYATPVGRFRVAVDPHLGPLLRDLLAAGAEPWPAGVAWAMWRQDAAGEVREIARFGSRADAELLAENLAARGSRQRFWLAAARH